MGWYIYVLKLQSDKYYVGGTCNVWVRLNAHFAGKGSEWTILHRPVAVELVQESESRFDEDNWTKRMMLRHGIINVRGGSYTMLAIPPEVERILTKELNTLMNQCFICGGKDHYAKKCPNRYKRSPEIVE
jgi:hypothetical protein